MNMEDKDKIKEVLKVLSNKLKEPQNKELLDEFLIQLAPLLSTGEQRLDAIYELCIEKIIKEQATAFYKDFPIDAIRPTLENDFVRMERSRRRNDFEDFCMAVYQQIECMVNKIGNDSNINIVAEKLFPYPAYSIDGSVSNRKEDSPWLVSHMVFGKGDYEKYRQTVASQWAMDKFKCILYFVCYKSAPKSDKYDEFNTIADEVYNVYKYRNRNHRGNKPTDDEQKIYDRIDPIRSFYYMKTIGLLAKLVEMIQNGYPVSQELITYANSLERKELKPQVNIKAEANTKKVEGKVRGIIVQIRSGEFEVRIDDKRYVVKGKIKDGINKGDNVEIDGYEIVFGNNISLNQYVKV